MKFLLTTLFLTLAAAAQAADGNQPFGTSGGAGFKGRAGGRGGEFRQKLLEKFDTNHDGKLEPDELQAAKAALQQRREEIKKKLLEKFDTNHNGQLDPDELAAAKAWIQEHKGQHQGKFGGAGGAGGAGRFGNRGAGTGNAQKTSNTPDSSADTEKDAVQKVMDQVNEQPSVKL